MHFVVSFVDTILSRALGHIGSWSTISEIFNRNETKKKYKCTFNLRICTSRKNGLTFLRLIVSRINLMILILNVRAAPWGSIISEGAKIKRY
jgi:hypothetical protein